MTRRPTSPIPNDRTLAKYRIEHGEVPWRSCMTCNKPINGGLYCVRETPDRFVEHHRACTENWPIWARFDAEQDAYRARQSALLVEAVAFRDQWSIQDLDELIDDLREAEQARDNDTRTE